MIQRWVLTLLAIVGLTVGVAGCSGGTGMDGGTDVQMNVTINSITVTPATASIALGATQQFTATANLSNGMTRTLMANEVTWASSMTDVAMINAQGLATASAMNQGTTTISAALTASSSIRGQATLMVTGTDNITSLQITPAMATLQPGQTQAYTAIARRENGMTSDVTTMVQWASSSTATATIASSGTATAVAAGTTNITASIMNARGMTITSNTAMLTVNMARLVSIAVTPVTATLRAGSMGTAMLTATGSYSDGTSRNITTTVTWTSSAPMIAAVSNMAGSNGVVTPSATMAGTANITAALDGITSTPAVITVLPSDNVTRLEVRPNPGSVNAGGDLNFTATATYGDGRTGDVTNMVSWTSAAPAVATIGMSTGLGHGVSAGMTMITATFTNPDGSTVTASVPLTVTPATLVSIEVAPATTSVAAGGTATFTATGVYSDMSSRPLTAGVNWSSTNTAVATVGPTTGVAMAVTPGMTTIRAEVGTVRGTATLVVTPATVTSITVTPANPTLAVGTTLPLTANAILSDGTTLNVTSSAVWSSSLGTIAGVNATGVVSALAAGGPVTISARFGGVTGNTNVTVSGAVLSRIDVTPATPANLPAGRTQQFRATGNYSDGTARDLTEDACIRWDTSNMAAAGVSNTAGSRGLATGTAAGVTQISATCTDAMGGSVTSALVPLNVTSAVVTAITVAPATQSTERGFGRQFTATADLSDGTTAIVTDDPLVTWTVSDATVATISNSPGTKGIATGVAPGTITVTASYGSGTSAITGTARLTVDDCTLSSIAISPSSALIRIGSPGQAYTATGTFTGTGSCAPRALTASEITWSSNPAVLVFTNNTATAAAGATPTDPVTVRATVGAVSGTATVRLEAAATLDRILVTFAPTDTLPIGFSVQATATGIYRCGFPVDCDTRDLTTQVFWASGNTALATVSNATGAQGTVTGVAAGTGVTITASYPPGATTPISGSDTVDVVGCAFSSVAAVPPGQAATYSGDAVIAPNDSQQLRLFAIYGSGTGCTGLTGTSFELSPTRSDVSWSSNNTSVATVAGGLVSVPASATNTDTAVITVRYGTSMLTDTINVDVSDACVTAVAVSGAQSLDMPAGTLFGVTNQLTAMCTLSSGGPAVNCYTAGLGLFVRDASCAAGANVYSDGYIDQAGSFTTLPSTCPVTFDVDSSRRCSTYASPAATLRYFDAAISALAVTTPSASIPLNTTVQMTATATYTGRAGTASASYTGSFPVNQQSAWYSSDYGIADVSNGTFGGEVYGVAQGTATIEADYGGFIATRNITINNRAVDGVRIEVDTTNCSGFPTTSDWPLGVTVPFRVLEHYTDGNEGVVTTVTSISGSSSAITFASPTSPIGFAAAAGTTTITVNHAGFSDTIDLTVTDYPIAGTTVTAGLPGNTLSFGASAQYRAIVTYSGGASGASCNVTDRTTWTALPTTRGTISSTGLVTATSDTSMGGPLTISGAFRTTFTASEMLTIGGSCLDRIELQPSTVAATPAGVLIDLRVVGITATGSVVDVLPSGTPGTGAGTLSPTTYTVVATGTGNFVRFTNNVAASGNVVVQYSGGPSCPTRPTTLTASIPVTFTSAALTAIAVDCNLASPNANFLASFGTPAGLSIPVGFNQQCRAYGTYSDGTSGTDITNQVTWTTNSATLADVSNATGSNGLVTTRGNGTATITAQFGTGTSSVSGSSQLVINTAAQTALNIIQPSSLSGGAFLNVAYSLDATADYRVGAGNVVSYNVRTLANWSVTPGSAIPPTLPNGAATVNNSGNAKGLFIGTAAGGTTSDGVVTVNASFNGGTGSLRVVIHPNAPVSVFVVPGTITTVNQGQTLQYHAWANYGGSNIFEVTDQAAWRSTDFTYATVSDAAGSKGLVTGVAVNGSTPVNIEATFGGLTGSLPVTVISRCVDGLQLRLLRGLGSSEIPAGTTIPVGAQVWYEVDVHYSDGQTEPLDFSSFFQVEFRQNSLVSGVASLDPPSPYEAPGFVQRGNVDAALAAPASNATYVEAYIINSNGACTAEVVSNRLNYTIANVSPGALNIPGGLTASLSPPVPAAPTSYSSPSVSGQAYPSGSGVTGSWDLSGSCELSWYTAVGATIVQYDGLNDDTGHPQFYGRMVGSDDILAQFRGVIGTSRVTITGATEASVVVEILRPQGNVTTFTCRDVTAGSNWTSTDDDGSVTGTNALRQVEDGRTRVRVFSVLSDGTRTNITSTANLSVSAGTATVTRVAGVPDAILTMGSISADENVTVLASNPATSRNDSITIRNVNGPLTGLQLWTPDGSTFGFRQLGVSDNTAVPLGLPVRMFLVGTTSSESFCLADEGSWSSSNATIATVSTGRGGGQIIGASVGGPVTINATRGPLSASTLASVSAATLASIRVAPTAVTLNSSANETAQFRAFATFNGISGEIEITGNSSAIWFLTDTAPGAGAPTTSTTFARFVDPAASPGLVRALSAGTERVNIQFTNGGTTLATSSSSGTNPGATLTVN